MEPSPESKSKNRKFQLYRYQLLARIDKESPQFIYVTPDRHYTDVNELRADKNLIFSKMLQKIGEFTWSYAPIKHEIVASENDLFLLRIGVNRPTVLRTEDFKSIEANDWPWIYIYIDNNSNDQIILVELDRDAWENTQTTINMLKDNFNNYLANYYLLVEIEPIIEKRAFWSFVESHKGKIEVVEFDMISPNMSNIAAKSKWPLREIRDQYNATRQKVRLENTANTSLDIKNDELMSSMADYSMSGLGKVRFKLHGLKSYKSLSDDKVGIEWEDLDIQSDDPKHFLNIVKKLSEIIAEFIA